MSTDHITSAYRAQNVRQSVEHTVSFSFLFFFSFQVEIEMSLLIYEDGKNAQIFMGGEGGGSRHTLGG